jgi:cytidine deaminase
MDDRELIGLASAALAQAYAPYSGFRVGACVVTPEGEAFSACNVENASFGLTICAERAAIFAAVAGGHRQIDKVAVVSERAARPPYPCGACLQVMSEFGVHTVIVGTLGGTFRTHEFRELLPRPFEL